MKWIHEFWRSFCALSGPEGGFWLTTPYKSGADKSLRELSYFGVPLTVLVEITRNCLTQASYIKTSRGSFYGQLLTVSENESPLFQVKVLDRIPVDIELTLHPNFVNFRAQFSDPNVSRGYCAFSLHADCLQILLKKKEVRDSEGVWVDLSLSAAVDFEDYYAADYESFVLLSREQVKSLLPLANVELSRYLFGLFGYENLSDVPGKYGTPFGCVTTDLTNKMEKFANSR